ncbi:hypothetical protein BDV96DRAFT_586305 [Lophiotrema nucula]|uniref:Coenzyme Q-binding protein COQ10 START domain-containing protein n=1 Tax=Lophiotrema nucula TaxID=690887 RepID=A0A6A5YRC5_9PLEO|nr:hypothetical protein BDV96DRAFT_586305 [Lophiotrema nucula]
MATKLLPLPRPRLHHPPMIPHLQQRRTFLPNPFASSNPLTSSSTDSTSLQRLSASRTLAYPHLPIYAIIADIESYPAFLPFCSAASVTRWSRPDDRYQRLWPGEAKMSVGYKGFGEDFTSLIFCVPGKVVESVGGQTETQLSSSDISHYLDGPKAAGRGRQDEEDGGILSHLRSRWTLEPMEGRKGKKSHTRVMLDLEFAFANPFYATLSAGAVPKVADYMIKAFEERVDELLKERDDLETVTFTDLAGSRPER